MYYVSAVQTINRMLFSIQPHAKLQLSVVREFERVDGIADRMLCTVRDARMLATKNKRRERERNEHSKNKKKPKNQGISKHRNEEFRCKIRKKK